LVTPGKGYAGEVACREQPRLREQMIAILKDWWRPPVSASIPLKTHNFVFNKLPFPSSKQIFPTRPQNHSTAPRTSHSPASSLNSNLKLNMQDNNKPDGKPEAEKPEKDTAGCLESFFGVFKNLFGCIKNAEEAYSHAPPQLTEQVQQVQVQPPQQVSFALFSKRWR
jgi:hypothetical protein